MTEAKKTQLRVIKWRTRGWTFERIAKKVGLKDRRFAQMAYKRGLHNADANAVR